MPVFLKYACTMHHQNPDHFAKPHQHGNITEHMNKSTITIMNANHELKAQDAIHVIALIKNQLNGKIHV
ncbi:hypothetical protein J2128_001624 [Methanomicrobium sp. W14]|nr:hypothetical protein [Methanomicrobium sp. W14]